MLYEAPQSPTFKTQLLQSIQVNDFCFETFIKLCYPASIYLQQVFICCDVLLSAYLSLYFPLIFKATFSDMSQVMFSPLLWELDKFHYLLPTTNKHRPRSRITSNRLYACSHSVPCTVVQYTPQWRRHWASLLVGIMWCVVYSNHLMIRIISSSSFHVSITSLKSGKINFD